MSPSNNISSVVSTGSPPRTTSPTGQITSSGHSTNRRCLNSVPSIAWLRPLSRVIRKKWFLTLILTMSAVYCIISFTPSINRSTRIYESSNYFNPKRYGRQVVYSDENFLLDQNLDHTQPQQTNSKLLLDHISSHELLALPPDISKINSVEESNNGQEPLMLTDAPSKINPNVFSNKLKITSKPHANFPTIKTNGSPIKRCRNSIQGRLLLADDQGYVCTRQFLTKGGCCNSSLHQPSSTSTQVSSTANSHPLSANQVTRYSCNTCNSEGCCAIFEYCKYYFGKSISW